MADPKNAVEAMSEALAPKTETPAEPATDAKDEGEEDAEADAGEVTETVAPDDEKLADNGEAAKAAGEGVADEAAAGDKKPAADAAKPDDKTADGADKKPAADAAAKKPADPVNDPIPQQVSERTRERITSLIGIVKERDAEVAQGRELFGAIESTGMSPEELGTMLSYSRLVHSDNIEDKRTAFNFLQGELRGLALQLGETTAGVNILDDYPDLKEQLEAGSITEKVANEVALSRERAKQETARTTQRNETEQELTAAREKGTADMTDLGHTLKAVDPNYEAKAAVLVPKLRPILAKMHPSQWVKKFREEYTALKLSVASAATDAAAGNAAGGVKPQPLRVKQPAGNGAAQPSNAREAMDAALNQLGK